MNGKNELKHVNPAEPKPSLLTNVEEFEAPEVSPTGKLDTNQLYRGCDRLFSRSNGARVLAYDPRVTRVHELNESLTFIFQMCDGGTPCEEMVIAFMKQFDLDVNDASRETYRALKLLVESQLIEAE